MIVLKSDEMRGANAVVATEAVIERGEDRIDAENGQADKPRKRKKDAVSELTSLLNTRFESH